ncbi:MAG: glycosyltransferase family 39 protein [candidate division FCPU426 bacterium]
MPGIRAPLGFWIPSAVGVVLLHGHQSVLGWICVLMGLAWAGWKPVEAASLPAPAMRRRTELVWLAGLVLLAAGLRWWRLEAVPPACWFDEAQNGLETLRILKGDWFIFTPRNNGRGALQFFWTAPFFAVFGKTVGALRLASAVAGAATVPLVWRLGRQWGGARIGLAAAGLLAVSAWHVSVSRLGFDAVMTPAFDAAMLLCLVLGLESAAWGWWAAAGLLAGLANYGYAASRVSLLLLALAAWFGLRAFPGGWQRFRPGVVAACLAAMIALAPLLSLGLARPDLLGERGRQVAVTSPGAALRNLRATLRMFLERGDANPRHNLPGRPMLDPATGVLALAGLALAWRRRGFPQQLVLAWLGVYIFTAGTFTDASPHGLRMLSAVIPACLLAAWGLEQALADFRLETPLGRNLALAVLLLSVGLTTVHAYFVVYPCHPAVRPAFSPYPYEVGRFVRALPPETPVQVSRRFDESVVAFVSGRGKSMPELDFSTAAGTGDPWVRILAAPEEAPWFIREGAYLWREIKSQEGERFWVVESKPVQETAP